MRKLSVLCPIVFLLSLCMHAADSNPPLLLRFPTVSKTQIVFNYAGDLWIVNREGGEARQLTSGVGVEVLPHFSPDGSMIAFTGEYDGNRDVFLVSATGGVPRRLTYHPADDRGGRFVFPRWNPPCVCSASQVAASMETLPRRPDQSDLDCQSERLQHNQNPAGQLR